MDISATIAKMKSRPGFSDNVGMILVHNGIVRSWSRDDRSEVGSVQVSIDHDRLAELRDEFLQHDGIYDIIVEAREGTLPPGEDLLFIIVAGDIREHVKPVLANLLDRIKAEAVRKQELPGPAS